MKDEVVCTVPIPQTVLKTLTFEEAMRYAKTDEAFQALLHNTPALSTNIRVIEDYGADVFITTRQDVPDEGTKNAQKNITNEQSLEF